MLLFDESKALEKALGEEATAVLSKILARQDEEAKRALATKEDISLLRSDMKDAIALTRSEMKDIEVHLIKWVAGMLVAQAAVVATLVKLL